jgi:probable rRNA maturation factor
MIVNRQRSVRVAAKDLNRFVVRARRALGLPSKSISICLVGNSEMMRWNRAYRGKKGPTDVLSFPAGEHQGPGVPKKSRSRSGADRVSIAPHSDGGSRYLGDIAIAPAVAKRNALRWGRTFRDEMRILILHGMLHLMGYDHETDTGQMDRRERRLRRELGLD